MTEERRFLVIRAFEGKAEVKRIEVTGHAEHYIERVERGLLRNMNTDAYFVDDVTETERK